MKWVKENLRHCVRINKFLFNKKKCKLKFKMSVAHLQQFVWQLICVFVVCVYIYKVWSTNTDGNVKKILSHCFTSLPFFQCWGYCIPFWAPHFKRNINILKYIQSLLENVAYLRVEGTRNVFPGEREIDERCERSV